MHMLRKFASLLLLLLYERSYHGNICIKNCAELLAADHFDQGLLIGLRHLSGFLQVLEVFLLTFQIIPQILHILQR